MLVLLFEVALAAIVPVSEVTFDVSVSGSIAEIEVRQTFRNDSSTRVDATYTFPLHNRAVVDGMKIRLEDRTIEGVILEKEEARKAYEEAVAQGKTAALTETQRWNLYQQEIGNIPPYAELEVILRIVQPVDRQGRTFELSLPVSEAGSFDGEPSRAPAADIAVEIDVGLPLKNVECVTHEAFEAPTGDGWTVLLNNVPPEQGPFVVRWELADDEAQIGSVYDGKHVLLLLEPPVAPAIVGTRNVLVLTEQRYLGLAQGVRGALAAYGWSVELQAPQAVPEALLQVLSAPSAYTDLVLVTDASWTPEQIDQVIAAATQLDGDLHLHGVGGSTSANRYVLDELADRTGGNTAYVPWDLQSFVGAIGVPTFADIAIDWGDWGAVDLASGIADVGTNKPVQILARTRYTHGGPIEITGTVGGERVTVRVDPRPVAHGRALGSTWARARIERLGRRQVRSGVSARDEGLPLALEYGILSPWTAFVAIDPRMHDAEAPPDAKPPEMPVEEEEEKEEERFADFEPEADEVVSADYLRPGNREKKASKVVEAEEIRITRPPSAKPAQAPSAPPRSMSAERYDQDDASIPDAKKRDVSDLDRRKTTVQSESIELAAPRRSYTSTLQSASGVAVANRQLGAPPPATGAPGAELTFGTEKFAVFGGIDRAYLDEGRWTQVPVGAVISTDALQLRAGYRFQKLTEPVQAASDRRRHAVELEGRFDSPTFGLGVRGLAQDLSCERCDGTRALAFDLGAQRRFDQGALQWSIGAHAAIADLRGVGGGLNSDRTGVAVGPTLQLVWAPRRFYGTIDVAAEVANAAGLQFTPTLTALVGPRFGDVWVGLGGGQHSDTTRPVRGVPRVREGWVGVGYAGPAALLRFGWEERRAPDAPQLEFMTTLASQDWRRRALFAEASVDRAFDQLQLTWRARYTHVLSTDADLNRPSTPYADGLLVAHRPFWTGGSAALQLFQTTSVRLDGGLASPVTARSWWAGWQAHAALGLHQGIPIRASRLGFGITGEVWSGRPGDPDPSRLDGWIAPDRAGIWALRASLTARY